MNPNSILTNATNGIGQDIADNSQNFQNNFNVNPLNVSPSTGSTSEAVQALQGSNPQAQQTQATHQPNLLQRLLPTLGGIGGGILGEVVDPFGGGVAGAALGAGLAGGGAAAGKTAENATEGKNLGSGVVASGLEGAAGQGLAEGAGAALGAAGKGLESTAQSITDKAALTSSDAISKQIYNNVPKGLRQAHNLDSSLDLADSLGLNKADPQSLVNAGSQANDILDTSVNDALGQAGPVDASDYNNIVKDAIAQRSGVLGSYEPTALGRGRLGPANTPAAKLLSQLQDYGAGVATPNADPTALRGLMQQVGKAYGDAQPGVTALTGAKDPVQVATHDALGDVYNNLKDKLFNRPEVTQNFQKLAGNIQAGDVGGNQALADHLNGVLGSATTAQPVLDSLKQFGDLRNVGTDGLVASKGLVSPVAKTGFSTGNAVDLGGAAEAILGHNPALGIVGPLAYHALQNPAIVGGLGKGAEALAGSGLGQGVLGAAGQTIANSPNDVSNGAGGGNAVSLDSGVGAGNATSPLQAGILSALYNPNSAIAGQLGTMVGEQQKVNAGQAAEQNLASIYNTAGGAQGPLGGRLGILGSLFTGGEAESYNAQAEADKQAIAQALGAQPSQIATPALTQDQSAAQASLGNIQSLIQALTQGGGSTGLVSAAGR